MVDQGKSEEAISLVVVRTPFQAWLAKKVLAEEKIKNYDFLYFTQNDSKEDRIYFSSLKVDARESRYFFVRPKKPDILSHLSFRWAARRWCRNQGYKKVFFASVDAHVPNAIISAQPDAQLITFDDGAANIFVEGGFHKDFQNLRARVYRRFLGAKSLAVTKERILRHYTIYGDKQNIVEMARCFPISGWCASEVIRCTENNPKMYFIGAPFSEVLEKSQIDRLRDFAKSMQVDFYVQHPREKAPLIADIPILDKQGRIAEEAILDDAEDSPIFLVGGLSSVMFNLALCVDRRIVIVPRGARSQTALVELARESGCEIVDLA